MFHAFLNDLFTRRNTVANQAPSARFNQLSTLLNTLPTPKKKYEILHLAGSKGKGTTAHVLTKTLHNLNYTTLLFTSPHLFEANERFLYKLEPISQAHFSKALAWLANYEKVWTTTFNFFDAMTAIAFYLANELEIDFLILETGIGGRLDATNICQPLATLITPIELEHTAILGTTLEAIAREKAGIIKQHRPVFLAPQEPSSYQVIQAKAEQTHSALYYLPTCIDYQLKLNNQQSTLIFTYHNNTHHVTLANPLPVLAENALLALLALDHLLHSPAPLITAWKKALNTLLLPARYQQICHNIIIDGSHTPSSFTLVTQTFTTMMQDKERILIFGCASDKDFTSMSTLFHHFSQVILVGIQKTNHHMHIHAQSLNLAYHANLNEFLSSIYLESNQSLLITGSLYLAAEALAYYNIAIYPPLE